MPVIEVSIRDLERLVGRPLSLDEVEDLLPRLKCEVEEVSGDVVVYEATHDRPDLYSSAGLARALKGLLGVEEGIPRYRVEETGFTCLNEGPEYRPYIAMATVRNVELDDEAVRQVMQLQEKLHATYGRGRRKVSIGVYDLSKVKPPFKYVAADPDSTRFVPLDSSEEMTLREILAKHPKGVEYGWIIADKDRYPLLVDSQGTVLSMPPIINSEDTRVTEDTRDLVIDVTSTSFEAGLRALALVATALAERGGTIGLVEVHGRYNAKTPNLVPETMEFNPKIVERICGVEVSCEEAAALLRKMRFDAEPLDGLIRVSIPAYRVDILHPVDLAEEVIMAYGYDRIVPEVPPPQHPGREDGLEVFCRMVKLAMVGMGFQEVNNYMLTCKELLYAKMNAPERPTVEVENPRQETFACLRTWIVPQLLQVLSRSKHADYPQRIFEVGDVALIDEAYDNMVREERHLVFAISHEKASFTDAHAVLDALMRSFGLAYSLEPIEHPSFIAGRTAKITVNGGDIGIIGEVHPAVLVNFELDKPVAAAELDLGAMRRVLLSKP